MTRILGISCYFHDAAAALIEDGTLIAAAEEERFSRIKHDFSFPQNAITFCLERCGIQGRDLDYVVFFEKPFLKFERLARTATVGFPRTFPMFAQSMRTWMFDKLWIKSKIQGFTGISQARILFSEHHLSHAASAYFCSPFESSAIVTIDGVGEWATTTIGRGVGNRLTVDREIRFPHSLGLLYSTFTAFLGFEVNEGEYKVMGMAPYGEPRFVDEVRQMVRVAEDGSYRLDPSYFAYRYSTRRSFTRKFEKLFGRPRPAEQAFFTEKTGFPSYFGERPGSYGELEKQNQYYADIAASIQAVVEDIVVRLAREAQRVTGEKSLCLAGGVALNSVANSRILEKTQFQRLYVQPAAGDGGGALGAALFAWHCALGKSKRFVMDHAYWGSEYDDRAIAPAIDAAGLSATRIGDEGELVDSAARRLADGKVVGWFQGRFEWGPRALGNRSILADPRRADMKDIVNSKIKFREPFRPFAPSVLQEATDTYFEVPGEKPSLSARFMLLVVPIVESRRAEIPAVDHLGTARLQTVDAQTNPLYHALISRFGSATGVPLVLNTSFNVRGEPIVNTPTEAIATFMNSGMDSLAMGHYLIDKN